MNHVSYIILHRSYPKTGPWEKWGRVPQFPRGHATVAYLLSVFCFSCVCVVVADISTLLTSALLLATALTSANELKLLTTYAGW